MDDPAALLPTPPISTAQPPASAYDSASAEFAPETNSLGEKIHIATENVLKKFNIVRRGRGRPKNDGSPKKSDLVTPIAQPAAVATPLAVVEDRVSVASQFNSPAHELFRRIVVKAAQSEISFLKGIVEIKAEAAGIEENFLKQALTAATPESKAFSDVGESADYVAIKYGWNVDRMPEIALCVDLLHLHAPFFTLFIALNAEIRRKRKAELSTNEAPLKIVLQN